MPRPRQSLVSLDATPYYHCVARCVRRAFLCGVDFLTGKSYEHRKQWVVDRLRELAGAFAIDVCAYAVMSNHVHVVVRIDAERAQEWSDDEVIERWAKLFALPLLVSRYHAGVSMTKAELDAVFERVAEFRRRLMDLSWFMRCLNEPIARQANAEDGCTGRFWEGRFKSQALLDEAAVLTCMSYVDLNPIRAGLAETPEDSDFTSIQARIEAVREAGESTAGEERRVARPVPLLGFAGAERLDGPTAAIPFDFHEYLQLVDWAGRAVRDGKRGAIAAALPPILRRLGIDERRYLRHVAGAGGGFAVAIGRVHALRTAAGKFGRKFLKGIGPAGELFSAG